MNNEEEEYKKVLKTYKILKNNKTNENIVKKIYYKILNY